MGMTTPVRFAILTPTLSQPGGAERFVYALIRYADPTRMRCVGVALWGIGGVDSYLGREIIRYAGIHSDEKYKPQPYAPAVKVHPTLNDAVRHVCAEADVLITWGSLSLGAETAGVNIPIICVSQCAYPIETKVTGITHLVGTSAMSRRFFAGISYAGSPLPLDSIDNGVEIDRTCPRRGRAWQRAEWGVSGDDKVLLYLGRQAMVKNPWAAVKVLMKLPSSYKLVMLGNQSFHPDEPMATVAKLVRRLRFTDRVRFERSTPFVGDALAGADCMVQFSFREADSLVLKEAFLAGLPVVHTGVGAIPEIEAEHGQIGWGVPFQAPEPEELLARPYDADPGDYGIGLIDPRTRASTWTRRPSRSATPCPPPRSRWPRRCGRSPGNTGRRRSCVRTGPVTWKESLHHGHAEPLPRAVRAARVADGAAAAARRDHLPVRPDTQRVLYQVLL